ncbi:MAG: SGNH/GDSL hydrolase family protein [Solirubrobacterales bacterium]|nr:SGNH/GDSL hydrolase family protein [Solirubrobacterales bacterium]
MRLPGFGRGPDLTPMLDPASYPESWLYPMDDRWLHRFRQDVRRARKMGMRDKVFAKVGDSNLATYNAFYGLGCREPIWGEHQDLEPVMHRYREIELEPGTDIDITHSPRAGERRPWNSFTRCSAAAMMGIVAEQLMTPPEAMDELPHWWKEDDHRLPGENALETELRITRPLYALVLIGTNGQNYGRSPEQTVEALVELIGRVRELGPVPVVMTVPPSLNHEAVPTRWEFAEETARLMCLAAARARVPLLNQWLALTSGDLVNCGLVEQDGEIFDGFHLDTIGGFDRPGALERSVDFRPEALRYGMNHRNLLVLKVLQELDSLTGTPDQE